MVFQIDYTNLILIPMARLGALFLLFLGIIWIVYGVYEGRRRGSYKERKVEDWDFKITRFLKVLTYLGFIVGAIAIVSGAAQLILNEPPIMTQSDFIGDHRNIFTAVLLIILGLFTFLKPLNDLPIASIIGLAVATIAVIFISLMIPQEALEVIDVFIDYRIVLVIIFIIIFAVAALVIKFYIGGLMALSKVISWPPLAIGIAIFCFLQSFLLLTAGLSLL
ncbi:MAG: hypothetical protein GF311_17910 [Candidatus Lokiarchaeota archaeon]|nr:hypothetical protein [Candidatus Lokiarchaeota archaeon]